VPSYRLTLSDGVTRVSVDAPSVSNVSSVSVTPAPAEASAEPAGPSITRTEHRVEPAFEGPSRTEGVAKAKTLAWNPPSTAASVHDTPEADTRPAQADSPPEVSRTQRTPPVAQRNSADPLAGYLLAGARQELADGQSAEAIGGAGFTYEWWASQGSRSYVDQLDRVRQEIADAASGETLLVGGAGATATALSAGYVLWLVRGGVLLASVMSSVPAWAAVDPLPILAQMRQRDNDDDEAESADAIEALFGRARRLMARPIPASPDGTAVASTTLATQLSTESSETPA
jgi:hypothetical protein